MTKSVELRLIARVAKMYYLDNMKQPDIAKRLYISQASVSRLLKKANQQGIVQISVTEPLGTFLELEEQIARYFDLSEVIIASCENEQEEQILSRIGQAAAQYLTTTIQNNEIIGISSWSASLLKMVDYLHSTMKTSAKKVVQIQGGVGNPAVQKHATTLTTRLAQLTHAEPILLSAQGIVGSTEAKTILMADPYIQATLSQFQELTMALVGIGATAPSKLLADSGNIFTKTEMDTLIQKKAIGDICLHFYDRKGKALKTPIDERVIGITLEQLKQVPRVIGIAGGKVKVPAILGALSGKIINILVTDQFTANYIAEFISKNPKKP